MQQEAQIEQMKMQLEAQKLEFEKWKVQLETDTKVLIAELGSKTDLHKTALNINASKDQETLTEVSNDGIEQPTSALQGLVDSINNNMQMLVSVNQQHNMDLAMQQQQAHQALIEQMTKPKQVIRDANGKIAGVA
jgi:hypothetical protein